eukprot:6444022-Alexandrium_andersonii.AAC.1
MRQLRRVRSRPGRRCHPGFAAAAVGAVGGASAADKGRGLPGTSLPVLRERLLRGRGKATKS